MKKSDTFKLLFFGLFLAQTIVHSYQQLPNDGDTIPNNYSQINLAQATGPESIAFDCKGEGPYVGVSDGRILKWQGLKFGWKEFAIPSLISKRRLCDGSTNPNLEPIFGRPLGLKFNHETCHLYIADAYFGLLVVGPSGGVAKKLANSADGIPFRFTNGLDINTNTGEVYFTESSIIFQRRYVDYLLRSTFDRTGRLLKYNPRTKKVFVLYEGLVFPNGVSLDKNNSFILVAESTRMRLLKFKLKDEEKGKNNVPEVFAQLPRVPDNIKMNEKGEFWVALNTGRQGKIQDDAPDPVAIKYDQDGNILKQLDGNGGTTFSSISEVNEFNGILYVGSVTKPYVGVLNT